MLQILAFYTSNIVDKVLRLPERKKMLRNFLQFHVILLK